MTSQAQKVSIQLGNLFFGENQEFKVSTKEEQEMALACRHLIQNAIVLWNYLYFSQKLSNAFNKKGFKELLTSIGNSSMMMRQHINMLGEYDFDTSREKFSFDLDKLIEINSVLSN